MLQTMDPDPRGVGTNPLPLDSEMNTPNQAVDLHTPQAPLIQVVLQVALVEDSGLEPLLVEFWDTCLETTEMITTPQDILGRTTLGGAGIQGGPLQDGSARGPGQGLGAAWQALALVLPQDLEGQKEDRPVV